MCQLQLRVLIAVWGHYVEVQVLASVLRCNDPRLKTCPGDVRQNLKSVLFSAFLNVEAAGRCCCVGCVSRHNSVAFSACFSITSVSASLFAVVVSLFVLLSSPPYFISSIKSYLAHECTGAYCAWRAAAQRIPETILFPLAGASRLAR